MSRTLRLATIVALAIGVVLISAWVLRRPLSEAIVARWFVSQGIPAHYRVTALSTDAVTLRDVALGPAVGPDLRADEINVRLGWSPLRPRVDRVTLVRPVLRATLGAGGLSLGTLDRLLPPPGAPATPLPDIDLTLVDARATLATRAGRVIVAGGGEGRLRGGFAGHFAVGETRLAGKDCIGRLPGATFAVATTRDGIRVTGSGAAAEVACADRAAVEDVGWHADLRLPPRFDSYAATVVARSGSAHAGGFAATGLSVAVDGAAATLTGPVAGAFTVAARGGSGRSSRVARVTATGRFHLNAADGNAGLTGAVTAVRATTALPLQPLRAAATRSAGTLAAPLADFLAARLDAAAQGFDATGNVVLVRRRGVTTGSIAGVTLVAASGVRLVQTGRLALTATGVDLDGSIAVAGGRLPATTLGGTGRWQNGMVTGRGALVITPWSVPGAAIDVSRLTVDATSGGVALAGRVRVSGAVGGGIVARGLGVTADARIGRDGSIAFGAHCLPVDWSGLVRGNVRLEAGRIVACPAAGALLMVADGRLRGGATIGSTAVRGSRGTARFAATSTPLRLVLSGTSARPRVDLLPVTLTGQIGPQRGRATIDAMVVADGSGRGRLCGAALDDPASPVRIDELAADWRLADARIDLTDATARIVDRSTPARFQPLRVADGSASLANGMLLAHGDVLLAATKVRLGRVEGRLDTASGRGTAQFDTGPLVFGPGLQPVDITESLRGIVANVRGPVAGTGHVDWTATGITSRGALRLDALALATEALGPVDGIAGTIVFDDLLALTTPPGQSLEVGRINPGFAVDDGVVIFRLLGSDVAAIEGIRWPYAGGTLALAPVTVRADDRRRNFLLTVDGIDAEQFLQRFEIKNLAVTGRFDGKLPLVFADGRGRIAGGRLVARKEGGLIQYVGEIGSAKTGAAARLAFDALRRLRYSSLTLDLDGDLDSELVTQLHFAGSNEAAATLAGGPLPVRATGLPFRFGITVRAPFRALLGTAASFGDVRPLLHVPPPPVQPK